jgi:hypothetical protein
MRERIAEGYILAQSAQIILDDREAAVVSIRLQPLSDDRSVGIGVLLEQFGIRVDAIRPKLKVRAPDSAKLP